MLFIGGVFSPKSNGQLRFHRVNAPTSKELNALPGIWSVGGARLGAPGQGNVCAVEIDQVPDV